LERLFVYQVIDAHTESQDLLWRFDAVTRLAEAQCLASEGVDADERKRRLDNRRFIAPGPFWWALDYASAEAVYAESLFQLEKPEKPKNPDTQEAWQPENGSVVLIDEIDKTNLELPNGLLEILGNNAVRMPLLQTTIGGEGHCPPLVIISTNEERELPAAFVRRCLVLQMDLPKEKEEFSALLAARGRLHFGDACDEAIYTEAAELVWRERERAFDIGLPNRPGQAEYLDMLRALVALGRGDALQQAAMLRTVSQFALRKYPEM
jgi:MoxR-like ATPase